LKAIIFDLGNVLVDFDHKLATEKIALYSDKTPQQIYQLFFDSEVTGSFEEGKISPMDFFRKIKRMLGLSIGFKEFLPIWNGIFFLSQKNHSVYQLASSLKGRYKLAILSNINILHFEYLQKEFAIFGLFDHIFVSYLMRLRKPREEIYRQALGALGSRAHETFYTDDRPELIAGANALGIRGFVFTGIERLKDDLRASGVILDERD
jgi:putative hydrolase of the HAD superfamily